MILSKYPLFKLLERVFVVQPNWYIYTFLCQFVWRIKNNKRIQGNQFTKEGWISGRIPHSKLNALLKALEKTNTVDLPTSNSHHEYVTNDKRKDYVKNYDQGHFHYCLSKQHLGLVDAILEELVKPIESCMMSSWKVVNVHCWKTEAEVLPFARSVWHKDKFAFGVQKMMIYLTEIDSNKGSTEIRLKNGSSFIVDGVAGTWLMCQFSKLEHREVPPKAGERVLLQITLAPALSTDYRSAIAGMNSQYPKNPWKKYQGSVVSLPQIAAQSL